MDQLATTFVTQFYQVFDAKKEDIIPFYHPNAMLTYQGHQAMGHDQIRNLLTNDLKFKTIAHSISNIDVQPCGDACMILIQGRCKSDQDNPIPFSEVIILQPNQGNWFIMSDMFRLSLHDG